MKIGVIGLGSIGQRHVRCLLSLGVTDIVALRSYKGSHQFLPEDLDFIKETYDYDTFFAESCDGIIIANPTSLHIGSLKKCLHKDVPIFVEKPLGASLQEVSNLSDSDTSQVVVGFNLRFNDMINAVRSHIAQGMIGRVFKATLYCGQYLPQWHPYADYRKEYYSRKDLGGGVLRTLSHEIDLMYYFFDTPKEIIANVEKLSHLDITVDDHALLLCKTINNALISIELDYFNPIPSRSGYIYGENGRISYSFSSFSDGYATMQGYDGNEHVLFKTTNIEWNSMYLQQMKSFVEVIEKRSPARCSFADGLAVMKVIDAADLSQQTKLWVPIL